MFFLVLLIVLVVLTKKAHLLFAAKTASQILGHGRQFVFPASCFTLASIASSLSSRLVHDPRRQFNQPGFVAAAFIYKIFNFMKLGYNGRNAAILREKRETKKFLP